MAKDEAFKVIAFCLISGPVLILNGFSRFKLKRQVEDMPTSPISTAAQGLVEFQGIAHAVASDIFMGHWSRPVACCWVEVQQWVGGKNDKWVTRFSGMTVDRFLITDQSGTSWVLAKNSDLNVESSITSLDDLDGASRLKFDSHVFPRLEKSGLFFWGSLDSGKWRIVEQTIEIGQDVYLLGYFKTRSIEKPVQCLIDHSGKTMEVVPRGGVMKYSVHPFVLCNEKQEALLKKLNIGSWMMIGGALLFSIGVLIMSMKG